MNNVIYTCICKDDSQKERKLLESPLYDEDIMNVLAEDGVGEGESLAHVPVEHGCPAGLERAGSGETAVLDIAHLFHGGHVGANLEREGIRGFGESMIDGEDSYVAGV